MTAVARRSSQDERTRSCTAGQQRGRAQRRPPRGRRARHAGAGAAMPRVGQRQRQRPRAAGRRGQHRPRQRGVERRAARRQEHALEEERRRAARGSAPPSPGSSAGAGARRRSRAAPRSNTAWWTSASSQNAVRAPARPARQPNHTSSASSLPRAGDSHGSKPPRRSNSSRRTSRFAVSNRPQGATTHSVRSNGPRARRAAASCGPGRGRRPRARAGRRAAIPAAGTQSASRNASTSPVAAAAPALRAAPGPSPAPRSTRVTTGVARASATVASRRAVVDHDHLVGRAPAPPAPRGWRRWWLPHRARAPRRRRSARTRPATLPALPTTPAR